MHHAAERWKKATGKPLIVSMGSVAASGGYYMAVPADRIFADRATATGSIGVVFIKPSLEQFYAKQGVRQEFWTRGDYMRGTSLATKWDERLQAAADSSVARTYDVFLAKVATGRKLPIERVREAAQGRVWTGEDAVALGLVDEIGGLEAAITEARRRAKIPLKEKIAPLEYRRPRGNLIERLIGSALQSAWAKTFGAAAALEGPAYLAEDWVVE
jgi:protease-4